MPTAGACPYDATADRNGNVWTGGEYNDYFALTASPDDRTLYYGAQQVEANIWKVERPKAAKR